MNQGSHGRVNRPLLALLTLDFVPGVGGVQEYLYEVGQRLASVYEVVVLTPVAAPLPRETPLRRVVLPQQTTVAFWKQLCNLRPARVLVGHAHPRLLLAAALHGQYAAIAYGNDFLAAQRRWHRPLFNRLLAAATPLITISEASAQRLRRLGIPAAHIVRPGANVDRFTPADPEPGHRPPTLLTVGRLVPRKGIDTMLRGLPLLLDDFPNLRYLLSSDGPDRPRLERLVQKLKLTSAVHFLGGVAPDALPSLYQQADIFVMLAREEESAGSIEGFGIVYLEASASGLPVVAARSGGSVEALLEGQTGLLVDASNPVQAAEAIGRLLHDPIWRRELGANGRRWVEREMNWDRAAQQMLRILAGPSDRQQSRQHIIGD